MKEQELLKLKEKIETAEKENQRLLGRKDQLNQELKDTYECESIEEAEEKLEKLYTRHEKIQAKIDTGLEENEEEAEDA
jgi:hypothetical protein